MKFKTVATVTAVVGIGLGLAYLFFGGLVVGRWGIEPTENILLLGRRMGSLYIGLGVMFFLARAVPSSPARTALTAGAAVALSLLALLGIYELIAGRVGAGILASIIVEFLLALGYIRVLLAERAAVPQTEVVV